MPEKPGGGGKPQEYDSEGKYKADSGITDQQAIAVINANPQYKAKYDSATEEVRSLMIQAIKRAVNEKYTKKKISERYTEFNENEYYDMAQRNSEILRMNYGANGASELLDAFENGYKGAGQYCFNFNKILRIGYQKAKAAYMSSGGYGEFPTEMEAKEKAERLQKLASSFKMPRDARVFRFVDENWLVSAFRPIVEQFGILPDDGYGYETLDRNIPIKDLAHALEGSIGSTLDGDMGFTSFSACRALTHMGKKNTQDTYKRIAIEYDVPEGTPCFISNYKYESEGLFPRGTNYFIKDVTTRVDEINGKKFERLVILCGIR